MNSLSLNPRLYPIVVREVEGYLVVSQPELGITQADKRFDQIQSAHEIGLSILQVQSKIIAKCKAIVEKGGKPPKPKKLLDRDPLLGEELYPISSASQMLGISPSSILRAVACGALPSSKTPKGQNRFSFKDLQEYKIKLQTPQSHSELKLQREDTYKVWYNMIHRCTNEKNQRWEGYGGRGIKVCSTWIDSFDQFVKDMGMRPPGMSLDRINNDGNYEPSNCRWATPLTQRKNQRIRKTLPKLNETDLFLWAHALDEA